MSLRRLLAVARKEYHHVTRDVRTLLLVTVAPAILLLTLAYVFSFDVNRFDMLVLDEDRTDLARQYVAELTSDGTFRVVGYVARYEEIDDWLQAGRADLALVIPPGTADKLRASRHAPVQAILDGVNSVSAEQMIGQLDARTSAFTFTLLPSSASSPARLDVRSRAWYNPSLKSANSMVPGLMGVVLSMSALALALALTRERELGSFEGIASTPVLAAEYLIGKALTYLGFGLVSSLLVVMVATFWFGVPFQGNLLSFLVLTACYLLATFGLSMTIATFVKSQQAAMMIIILVFFVPSLFLAGLVTPIDNSSVVARVVAVVLPATHFIVIARGVFLKGLGPGGLLAPMLILLSIAGVTLTLSLALFRKRIE